MTPELSPESQKALQTQQIKSKVEDLTNTSRLIANALNLICSNDVQIPSAYAQPVAEIQQWLQGMHKNVQTQLDALKPLIEEPKVEEKKSLEVAK